MFEVQKRGVAECLLGAVLWPLLFQTRELSQVCPRAKVRLRCVFLFKVQGRPSLERKPSHEWRSSLA